MAGKRHLNKRNLVAVVVIAAIAVMSVVGVKAIGSGTSARVAVVHDGEGGVTELPLDVDATRTVTTSLGSNTVVVSGGEVRVSEADCPNQDCIGQGSISSVGEQIVCLPHKLWVEVVSAGPTGASDDGTFDVESR